MIVIKNVTRGHIDFEFNGKSAKILGEMLIRSIGGLDYILYENSLIGWEKPFENELISAEDKSKILKDLLLKLDSDGIKAEIE